MSGKEDDTRVKIQGEVVDGQEGAGGCIEGLLWVLSVVLCCITFPFSLFVILKQVQVSGNKIKSWIESSLNLDV